MRIPPDLELVGCVPRKFWAFVDSHEQTGPVRTFERYLMLYGYPKGILHDRRGDLRP